MIGDVTAAGGSGENESNPFTRNIKNILFVVYTERIRVVDNGRKKDVIRLISARMANGYERGLYYGKI